MFGFFWCLNLMLSLGSTIVVRRTLDSMGKAAEYEEIKREISRTVGDSDVLGFHLCLFSRSNYGQSCLILL